MGTHPNSSTVDIPITVCSRLVNLSSYENGPIWMRIEDTLLDSSEAEAVTSQMYQLIRPYVQLQAPDQPRHLSCTKYQIEPEHYKRHPQFETEAEFRKRLERLKQAPGKNAKSDAEWIWRAQVVIKVLNLLQTASKGNHSRLRTKWTSFDPMLFYEYAWICFKGGQGVRVWKSRPGVPPGELSKVDQGKWLCDTANRQERFLRSGTKATYWRASLEG
jgi:hypothetical protein